MWGMLTIRGELPECREKLIDSSEKTFGPGSGHMSEPILQAPQARSDR